MVTMAFVSSRFNAWCACSPHVTGGTRQYGAVLVFSLYLCLFVSRLLALPLFPPSGLSFFYYQYKGSVVMRERNNSLTCRKRGTPLQQHRNTYLNLGHFTVAVPVNFICAYWNI